MATKIYWASTSSLEDSVLYAGLYSLAGTERKKKIDAMRMPADKRRSLGAGILLKHALAQEGVLRFEVKENADGKPYLSGGAPLFFNLSHSGDRVMCAVSNHEIGCDVERIKDQNLDIARRYFSGYEYEKIMAADESGRSELFVRLWTLKESFAKAAGVRLFDVLENVGAAEISGERIIMRQSFCAGSYEFKEYRLRDGYGYACCMNGGADFPETMTEADFDKIYSEGIT